MDATNFKTTTGLGQADLLLMGGEVLRVSEEDHATPNFKMVVLIRTPPIVEKIA